MLDNLKYIHERDTNDALGVAGRQWQQLRHSFDVVIDRAVTPSNMVLAGMGGSALPGLFLPTWPGLPLPLEIVRSYDLPEYVNKSSLVLISSYSGNTEETLSALDVTERRRARIVVLAAGGQLAERAQAANYPLFSIPAGIQPRMSSFYFLRAMVSVMAGLGLIGRDRLDEMAQAASWLEQQLAAWTAEVPTARNLAKQIALELMGKTVIVYSGPKLAPVANKWKIGFNENAKNLAWWNQYPEFNHNEFIGWTSHPVDKPFAVVEIRSSLEHPQVQKRFRISERLLSGRRPAPITVIPSGDSLLQQLLYASCLGDFVSIYLALLNGLNPTPVALVEKLKKTLAED